MPRSRRTVVVSAAPVFVVLAVLALVSGCGAAHQASAAVQAAGAAASAVGTAPPAGSAGTVSPVSLRVANLFFSPRTPGGPLDVYDARPDPNATTKPVPLIAAVPYGAFSDYVHPHEVGFGSQKTIELWALPAGTDPVAQAAQAQQVGGVIDDGSQAQVTLRLTGPDKGEDLLPGPLAGLAESLFVEKGDDGQGSKGPLAPPAAAGAAEILASAAPAEATMPGGQGYYLFVDSSCAPPLNGDPSRTGRPGIFAVDGQAPVSSFAVFATTAGAHQLSVVENSDSTLPACSRLGTRQGSTSVTLADGQQAIAFVYGGAADDLHLAVGPIAP